MNINSYSVYKEHFNKFGYVILPNVFKPNEINDLRNEIKLQEENLKKNISRTKSSLKDVLSYPSLSKAILKNEIVDLLRILLDEKPIYWGESSFRWNENPSRAFHNDAKNDNECPFKTKYNLLRFGIYLQDHDKSSGGLKIWPKSNSILQPGRQLLKKIFKKNYSLKNLFPQQYLKSVNLKTKAGDVVIWNLRTAHSGSAVRLKFLNNISFGPKIENIIFKYLHFMVKDLRKERCVIFATFGAKGYQLENYMEEKSKHEGLKIIFGNSNWDKEIKLEAKNLGVVLDERLLKTYSAN